MQHVSLSPERETFEPLPLSIQIHSVRLRCLFSPRYLYLRQKMYIYYFMLYLTEGKLLRYFPLWREMVESRIHYVNQKEWQEYDTLSPVSAWFAFMVE